MSKRKGFEIQKQELLPGFTSGRYEPPRVLDRPELGPLPEDCSRRDCHVSVRISGRDLQRLQQHALQEGIPLKSLLASIIHQHALGVLAEDQAETDAEAEATRPAGHSLTHTQGRGSDEG